MRLSILIAALIRSCRPNTAGIRIDIAHFIVRHKRESTSFRQQHACAARWKCSAHRPCSRWTTIRRLSSTPIRHSLGSTSLAPHPRSRPMDMTARDTRLGVDHTDQRPLVTSDSDQLMSAGREVGEPFATAATGASRLRPPRGLLAGSSGLAFRRDHGRQRCVVSGHQTGSQKLSVHRPAGRPRRCRDSSPKGDERSPGELSQRGGGQGGEAEYNGPGASDIG